MSRIDDWIDEWARDVIRSLDRSGYSGINVVEKILRDPGISSSGPRDRVLWWPRNKRIAKVSSAMHRIDPITQICLIVDSGCVANDDGTTFDVRCLKQNSSLSVGEIRSRVRDAKRLLRGII